MEYMESSYTFHCYGVISLTYSITGKGSQLYLVGGLEHGFYDFPYLENVIIPNLTFTPSFFRGVGQPPTR